MNGSKVRAKLDTWLLKRKSVYLWVIFASLRERFESQEPRIRGNIELCPLHDPADPLKSVVSLFCLRVRTVCVRGLQQG